MRAQGVEIPLDLSRHCIQTELRRQHNRAVSQYFRAGPAERLRLEPLVEALGKALETLDFAQLRTRYPALSGGSDMEVRLSFTAAGWRIALGNTVVEFEERG